MIRENVLDLTHIAFLHANTFKQKDWVNPPEAFMDGETVVYRQEFAAAPRWPFVLMQIAAMLTVLMSRRSRSGCRGS